MKAEKVFNYLVENAKLYLENNKSLILENLAYGDDDYYVEEREDGVFYDVDENTLAESIINNMSANLYEDMKWFAENDECDELGIWKKISKNE